MLRLSMLATWENATSHLDGSQSLFSAHDNLTMKALDKNSVKNHLSHSHRAVDLKGYTSSLLAVVCDELEKKQMVAYEI